MQIIAITPGDEHDEILVKVTEEEMDYMSGIGKRPHVTGRYKNGQEIDVGRTFKNLDRMQNTLGALRQVPGRLSELSNRINSIVQDLES